MRKAGYKFLRGTPGYGQRWIDRYGRDPEVIEQVGLFALHRGGHLPPTWTEMQQREFPPRFQQSLNAFQELWSRPETELQRVEGRIQAFSLAFQAQHAAPAGSEDSASASLPSEPG